MQWKKNLRKSSSTWHYVNLLSCILLLFWFHYISNCWSRFCIPWGHDDIFFKTLVRSYLSSRLYWMVFATSKHPFINWSFSYCIPIRNETITLLASSHLDAVKKTQLHLSDLRFRINYLFWNTNPAIYLNSVQKLSNIRTLIATELESTSSYPLFPLISSTSIPVNSSFPNKILILILVLIKLLILF